MHSATLRDVMTEKLHYCYENDNVQKIAQLMEDEQVRRLVVLNDEKRMTGIISLGNIATKINNPKLCSEVADGVSQP